MYNVIMDCLTDIYDEIDSVKEKITNFEEKLSSNGSNVSHPTYASVAANAVDRPTEDARLEKLEYAASEQERERRAQEMRVTHPSIDNGENRFESTHVRIFFWTHGYGTT